MSQVPTPPVSIPLTHLPPRGRRICKCHGVSEETVIDTIKKGYTTVMGVGITTRAGTGCGGCRVLIRRLIDDHALAQGERVYSDEDNWYVPAIPMDKPSLIAAVRQQGLRSVSAVMTTLSTRDDAKSRMGLASLLKWVWGDQFIDEPDSRFVNDRLRANIQKDGTFSVVPRIYGGVTSADELIRIGQVAKKYNVRMVKLTGGQRIELLGIRKEDLPAVWADLGMPSGGAYTHAVRGCKTCVGAEFCRFGTADSTTLGIAVEKSFGGLELPHKVKLAVSACGRNCAESTVKDVGIVANERSEWELYVGGAAGSRVRKADLLAVVKTEAEVLQLIGRFLRYYQENARWLERTYDFVPRIGIEKLHQILVLDSLSIGARLDAEMALAIARRQDPWENAEPSRAQFHGSRRVALPILVV